MSKLYFAYGSNLNLRQMSYRCPDARIVGSYVLHDARLVFRMVADVVFAKGETVQGGLWEISEACEARLDRYEGVGSGLYRKVTVRLETPIEGHSEMLLYVMNSDGIMPPAIGYLEGIREGYRSFGLKLKPLHAAVERAHDEYNPSYVERQRHRRKGRPVLASRPSLRKLKVSTVKTPPRVNAQQDFADRCTERLEQLERIRRASVVYGD